MEDKIIDTIKDIGNKLNEEYLLIKLNKNVEIFDELLNIVFLYG